MPTSPDRILLVDDEQAVLDGLVRQHRKHFTMVPACGSEAGLRAILEDGPFSVVVSDYQMPLMNGTQFLARIREHDPEIIRIMLTGQADLKTTIDAVNLGSIFRFLTKPCLPEVFRECLEAAIQQSRLQGVERELLEQTVRGSIEVLADVLALTNPWAFGRATRVRGLVRQVVDHLGLKDAWQYETAALLSQVGYVMIPQDSIEKMAAGEELPADQAAMVARHPTVARELLLKIPRLRAVAEMVFRQNTVEPSEDKDVLLGGQILSAALRLEKALSMGATRQQALASIDEAGEGITPDLSRAFAKVKMPTAEDESRVVGVQDLRVGMIIQEDIRNSQGSLVVSRGHEITEGSRQRLRNYAEFGYLEKPEFHVHLPTSETEQEPSEASEAA